MIGLRRTLSLTALAALLLSQPGFAQVQATFNEGVELMERGELEAALAKFQAVLAANPSHEEAYELWQSTDDRIWLKLLVAEGEAELVAKRLMSLASMGRMERRNDQDAIRGLLRDLDTEDVAQRTRTVRTLAAEYGQYAVPLMIYALADQANGDRRVITMQALTQMGDDVVPPLIEALDSSDPFLRRNVALTLGYIGDPRANGVLALLAGSDENDGVRAAAMQALERTGGTRDALGQLLELGDAYHNERPSVLRPDQVSEVVWHWGGDGLFSTEVPRFLYPGEMAKKSFYRALDAAPGSLEALAGIARVSVAQRERVAQWERAGQDVGTWSERLAADELAVRVAGAEALDLALGWALDQDDQVAASGLCRALAHAAPRPTPNLARALASGTSGAVRGEAGVALAWIAQSSGSPAGSDVVAALAQSAGREIVQIAAIIDGDAPRREALAAALAERGLLVNAWPTGGRGLAALRSIPGVDVLLVADPLPDLTFHQVATEVRDDPRTAETPILVITADPDTASELHGDVIAGTVGSAGDVDAVVEALSGGLSGDRAEANALAARSAQALARLGTSGTGIAAAADALASTLASRPDEVTVPAMKALGMAGGADHVASLVAVVTDESRSDEARFAAAEALAGIFGRVSQASDAAVQALHAVVTSDAPFDVRSATANALGRLRVPSEMRADLMRAVRADIAQ